MENIDINRMLVELYGTMEVCPVKSIIEHPIEGIHCSDSVMLGKRTVLLKLQLNYLYKNL